MHNNTSLEPALWTLLRRGYGWSSLRRDLSAGLTVAVVALPLSMALAIASGSTPEKGLHTAIVAGFLISALGGSRVQIGGPTGAFIPVIFGVIHQHGYEGLLLATMMAALILLVASQIPAGHIKKLARHPMLVAVKLWATGHLLSNGELNSVILFGAFLAYAVFDRIMVKRRGDNGPGPDVVAKPVNDIIAVVVGLVAYVAIAHYLHPILFGVSVR